MNKKYQLILCWRHACEFCESALRLMEELEEKYPDAFDYVRLNNLENVHFFVNKQINEFPTWIIQEDNKEVKRASTATSLQNMQFWLKDYLK